MEEEAEPRTQRQGVPAPGTGSRLRKSLLQKGRPAVATPREGALFPEQAPGDVGRELDGFLPCARNTWECAEPGLEMGGERDRETERPPLCPEGQRAPD